MLRVVVLGAAAGGGVPSGIADVRCAGSAKRTSRTQSTQASIAFSADGEHWFLVNASPDLRQQLIATPQLHPAAGRSGTARLRA